MITRPSSLDAQKLCPVFVGSGSDFADKGTARHKALSAHFAEDDTLLDALPEEDQVGVRWAAEYIRLHAAMRDHEIYFDKKGSFTGPDFADISGTPDCFCGNDIFDLKWRPRDYTAQMAAYALMRWEQGVMGEIKIHILFGATQRAQVFFLTQEAAEAIVFPIVSQTSTEPNPCEYCSWCANKLTCSAHNERALAINAGREDWHLENYHPSEITKPSEMAKALKLWRQIKKWGDSVDFHAKEMVTKQGLSLPGFEAKYGAGKSSCFDILGAFQASGLSTEEFLKCCELRMNTSKENIAKAGIIETYSSAKEIPKTAAKKELKKLMQPYMRTAKDILKHKSTTETPDNDEE